MAGTWILFFIRFLLNDGEKSQDLRHEFNVTWTHGLPVGSFRVLNVAPS